MTPMKPMRPMEPMKPMAPMSPATQRWWPDDLGEPSSSGAQNDSCYAYFRSKHRLAYRSQDKLSVYDTQQYQINGFAQDSSSGQPRFDTQDGPVALSSFRLIDDGAG